jgi:hypothetical protein
LSQNQLSTIKEIANLRQLRTLDLSFNKFKELDKLVEPLSRLHQLKIVDFTGNLMAKAQDFKERAFRMLPQIAELNPAQIVRLSQFVGLAVNEKKSEKDYAISPIAFTLPYSKNLVTYN